jgi:hypothetical protein
MIRFARESFESRRDGGPLRELSRTSQSQFIGLQDDKPSPLLILSDLVGIKPMIKFM